MSLRTRSELPESTSLEADARGEEPGTRLAASQVRRMRSVVDAAVELAEQGGFDAVRLRDVAERSGVSLGTLYKYFRGKEDLLLFAFQEELEQLERVMAARPAAGETPHDRVSEFFRRATRGLSRKPQLSRAMLRASATGDSDTALKIANTQLRVSRLIVAALRGVAPDPSQPLDATDANETEAALAAALVGVWFSALIGWAADLFEETEVTRRVRAAADLMLGARRTSEETK